MVVALCVSAATAEFDSNNHLGLKRVFSQYREADTDKNGVMTFAEYTKLLEKKNWNKGRAQGPLPVVLANGDMMIEDFEINSITHMGWKTEGEAFRQGPPNTTRIMKRRVGPFSGKYMLSTYYRGEEDTGKAISPPFDVDLKYLEFLISGGQRPGRLCVNLIINDQVVRSATGLDDDYFERVAFDITEFNGKQARVQIVDDERGIWGHINVDRIHQTDQLRTERIISVAPDTQGARGHIQTTHGRHKGSLSVTEGRIGVGTETIELGELLIAVTDARSQPASEPHALRLKNGEVWPAKILDLEKNQMSVESSLFNKRNVPLAQIASLDFQPQQTFAQRATEPGTLYRTQGEPIPGKLVWIRDKDIAIECVLGVVPVPRDKVRSFVLSAPGTPKSDDLKQDEIGLTNGSVLRGKIAGKEDRIVMEHPVLGSLAFEWGTVKYIQRARENVTWLEQLKVASLEQTGPVASPPPPAMKRSSDQRHLRATRILPHTVVSYDLPFRGDGKLRGELAPVSGCRADMKVELLVDGNSIWKKHVAANSDPMPLDISLPKGSQITINVNFDKRLAFPCGVDWRDAHVIGGES